ncbi:hypothetical protein DFH09DRAFT_1109912 [Mycena vulgaris]|nr:hypothetical protein DFH09DRAFT_1109912 [Mycena vulgaris]
MFWCCRVAVLFPQSEQLGDILHENDCLSIGDKINGFARTKGHKGDKGKTKVPQNALGGVQRNRDPLSSLCAPFICAKSLCYRCTQVWVPWSLPPVEFRLHGFEQCGLHKEKYDAFLASPGPVEIYLGENPVQHANLFFGDRKNFDNVFDLSRTCYAGIKIVSCSNLKKHGGKIHAAAILYCRRMVVLLPQSAMVNAPSRYSGAGNKEYFSFEPEPCLVTFDAPIPVLRGRK